MNRDELMKLHAELNTDGVDIMERKNHDYAGASGDKPFANFVACELLGVSTEKGMMVRMMDKLMRLNNYLNSGEMRVEDESFRDTIVDLRNYLVLLLAYITQKAETRSWSEITCHNRDCGDWDAVVILNCKREGVMDARKCPDNSPAIPTECDNKSCEYYDVTVFENCQQHECASGRGIADCSFYCEYKRRQE